MTTRDWTQEEIAAAARNLVRRQRVRTIQSARDRFLRLLRCLERADKDGVFRGFEGRVFVIGSATRVGDFFPHSDFDFVVISTFTARFGNVRAGADGKN